MSAYHYTYTFPVALQADRETVYRALTDSAALMDWFAEHAEIDLKLGGAFHFWGRHTLATSQRNDATQVITEIDAPGIIVWSWRFLDCDSQVRWTLAEDAKDDTKSKITVEHIFDSLPAQPRAKELIDDLWRLHTGNLCFYIKGDGELYRPDFDDPSPVVTCHIIIDAPREKVFAALIMPEHIKKWFGAPKPIVEPRVGGKYGFGFSFEKDGETVVPPPMEILEFVENERLVFTWPDWRGDPSVPDQFVAWTLEDAGGKTRLTLEHAGFTRASDVSDYPLGWQEFLEAISDTAVSIQG